MQTLLIRGGRRPAPPATPCCLLLRRTGRLDVPNDRSSHVVPTPRGGGLALLAGVAAAALAALVVGPAWSTVAWAAVAGCVALALVGFADDLFGLARPAAPARSGQSIGAAVGAVLGGWVGAALGAVVIPAAVNMVNFMDGINGICAGHAVVWGAGALAASAYVETDVLTVLGALSLGCGLGFLPWNVPRARFFLGDVGSYLMGGMAGIGVLTAATSTMSVGPAGDLWLVLGLVCAPYLLFAIDTSTTLARRRSFGEHLFEAHRGHIYQRLVHELALPHWVVSVGVSAMSALVTWAVTGGVVVGLITATVAAAIYVTAPQLARRTVAS